MPENSQERLASIESKLEVILSKIEAQSEQISTLNDIVWKSSNGKSTIVCMTERQEVRLSLLEDSTQKRLDFIQGIVLATIPIILTGIAAVFMQDTTKKPQTSEVLLVSYELT